MMLFASALAHGQAISRAAGSRVEAVVEKTGLLSGKKHVLSWERFSGTFSVDPPKVDLTIEAESVRVLDDWLGDGKREDVRKEAVGKDVLNAAKYSQIRFVSTAVTGDINSAFQISGNLTVRGMTKAVTLTVRQSGAAYEGETKFPMSAFGIKPPKAALGAIGTKDELTIRFHIKR